MPTATEVADVDLSHWVPGARLFAGSDGKFFVVDSDQSEERVVGSFTIKPRPTVILYTDETGFVLDLEVDFSFPPGTTPEEAVQGAGYTLELTNV